MKMTKALLVGTVAAAALTACRGLSAADFSTSDLTNRAIAASPRAREQFPWLTRPASPQTESRPVIDSVLAAIKKNSALAASPRMRELYPELARGEQSATVASSNSGTGESKLDSVMKNGALVRSPRMLEEFPELARGYTPKPAKESFEIAPLK